MNRKRYSIEQMGAAVKQHEMGLPSETLKIGYRSFFSGHRASVFTPPVRCPTAAHRVRPIT